MDYILFGLGNPEKYRGTRHNIGKDFIEAVVKNSGSDWKKIGNYRIATTLIGPHIVTCLLTDGYMNESGIDLKSLLREIDFKKFIIFHDEIDLPLGSIRLVKNRGDGGHKGIKSIMEISGSRDFYRFRIGIGKKDLARKYLLEKFLVEELEIILSALHIILPSVLNHLFSSDEEKAIQKCNTSTLLHSS